MNRFYLAAAALFTGAALASAASVTLQDGLDGYTGCSDISIYNDGKAENYSLYDDGYWAKPDQRYVVNAAFKC